MYNDLIKALHGGHTVAVFTENGRTIVMKKVHTVGFDMKSLKDNIKNFRKLT